MIGDTPHRKDTNRAITMDSMFIYIYTSEDLKWDAPLGRISNQHWNPTLAEIKCPILFLQGFKVDF